MEYKTATPENTRIGWVGTGVMGLSMCRNLMDAGYQGNHFLADEIEAQSLIDAGATWVDSPKEVAAASDVSFAIVGMPEDVESVFMGDTGLLAGASEGDVSNRIELIGIDLLLALAEPWQTNHCQCCVTSLWSLRFKSVNIRKWDCCFMIRDELMPDHDHENEPDEIRDLRFRFSLWDMVFFTSFVAVVLAVPSFVLVPLVSASFLVLMLLGFFFLDIVFFGARRHWQVGVMSSIRMLILRSVAYSTLIIVVGTISLVTRNDF